MVGNDNQAAPWRKSPYHGAYGGGQDLQLGVDSGTYGLKDPFGRVPAAPGGGWYSPTDNACQLARGQDRPRSNDSR